MKILLVEDDEDDYIITRDLFDDIQGAEFELDWAATYADAMEAIGHKEHDVYSVDYRLSEHNGLDLSSLHGIHVDLAVLPICA